MSKQPGTLQRLAFVAYLIVLSVFTSCNRPPAPGERGERTKYPQIVFVGLLDGDPRWEAIEARARRLITSYQGVRFTVLHPIDDSPAALEVACRNAVQLGAN